MRVAGPALVCFCFLLALSFTACQPLSRTVERESSASDVPLFDPTDLRIHPFTAVKDWTGDNKPDGIEALLELQDRFRDPTKGSGSVLFELYTYRRNYPDPRGDRLAAWRGSLLTLEEQKAHWNRISRTYSFQLAYPDVRTDKSYVLQVWFDQGGRRLVSQVVLESQETPGATTQPTAIPVTQPVLRPATLPAPATQPTTQPPPTGQPTPRTPQP
jgi:hypothetical protein